MNVSFKKLIILFMIGEFLMVDINGCSPSFKYDRYAGKNPALNFTIEYLSGWLHDEQTGAHNSFSQVVFVEPEGKDKIFKPMIVATVRDSSKIEIEPKTVANFAKDLLSKRMKFKECSVIYEKNTTICGEGAVDIELSYQTIDKLDSVDAKLVPFKERVIIFEKSGKFYILRYQGRAKDFDKYSGAFTHIVKSLEFI